MLLLNKASRAHWHRYNFALLSVFTTCLGLKEDCLKYFLFALLRMIFEQGSSKSLHQLQ